MHLCVFQKGATVTNLQQRPHSVFRITLNIELLRVMQPMIT